MHAVGAAVAAVTLTAGLFVAGAYARTATPAPSRSHSPTPPTPQTAAQVCVTKYNDLNGNGMRDTGEPVLAGWIFTVKNAAGAIVDFGVTNAQGHYCTTQALVPGAASVIETPKPGWTSTDPSDALPTKTMTLVAGQTWNGSFGNRVPPPPPQVGKICIAKFHDVNGNGAYVSGEPFLSGWQFTISGPSGPITLTTGTTGSACTPNNLQLGTYVITEVTQPGWFSTTPGGTTPQRTVTVTTASGQGPNVMFGNWPVPPQRICVIKYQDLNRNGQRNTGEPPLAGFTFEVRNASAVVVATGATDPQGRWCTPANLPVGAYNVTEVPKPWWVSTDPQGPPMASPPYDKSITLTASGGQLLFGNIKSGRACIFKYNDLNGNGHRDPGEPPLAGWTFRGRYTSWTAAAEISITTDASGMVCVDLPPGPSLQFDETMQPGWTSTDPVGVVVTPGNVWVHEVFTVVEGQTTNLVFGNHSNTPAPSPPGVICIAKYNDLDQDGTRDSGEAGLPGWVFNLKTSAGSSVGSLTANAQGQACVELPAGVYAAFEVMQTGWSNSDPPGAGPHKLFTVVSNQTVNLVFGNYYTKPKAHDVGIKKTGGGNFSVGAAVAFVLHVENIGPGPVGSGGLTVTDTLPAGFSSITAGGMGVDWNCTVSGQTVTCNYTGASIGTNQSFSSIVVHAVANSAGNFRNCAHVQYNGGNETALGNNDSCTSITVKATGPGSPKDLKSEKPDEKPKDESPPSQKRDEKQKDESPSPEKRDEKSNDQLPPSQKDKEEPKDESPRP